MNIKLRIPTTPYAFVEVDIDEADAIPATQVKEIYEEYSRAFKVGKGLEDKEWHRVLDTYRKDKGMKAEEMEQLDEFQSSMIHELDKSNNRLAYKASKK